ncbi:hypothetical protein BCF33_0095 [Hasllibacter halocynthiae]|uniref:Uncharacterized protein n=2 Tax=Hasllibacter halocynthiae TaxID=595589 RepID=A0A2T0X6K7_9RHOB|nr:hypothetical protein BCF33_0095 [Hasllibacter halocynthiae]
MFPMKGVLTQQGGDHRGGEASEPMTHEQAMRLRELGAEEDSSLTREQADERIMALSGRSA